MFASDGIVTSEETNEVASALASAQGELTEAGKTSFNPGFKSKYADLAEVLQTIRPVASKYGLSYVQALGYSDGLVLVTTRLMHRSGQFIQACLGLPINKKDPQGVGMGATYGRRYSLASFFGIAQDDDDGEANKTVKKTQGKESGTGTPNQQGPSPIAAALSAKFDTVLGPQHAAEMKAYTSEFASLTPSEQAQVIPAAKEARKRVEGAV